LVESALGQNDGVAVGALGAVVFDFGNTLFGHASLATTIEQSTPVSALTRLGDASVRAAGIEALAHSPEELALGRDLDPDVWETRTRAWYRTLDDIDPSVGDEVYRRMHAPEEWRPFASSLEAVSRLHAAGVRVGVLSNTGWDVRTVFQHHGLDPFIDAYALSYEIGAVKPQPEAFLAACSLIGADPAHTLMVGDDPRADSGATAVGMRVLLLPLAEVGAENGLESVPSLFANFP
jgi:putative hydrolase of the HAD superfamily